jgi:hypothetical protein
VQVDLGRGCVDYRVEDWWDRVHGRRWISSAGYPGTAIYAVRVVLRRLPIDDEVLYGEIDGVGHIVHVSEIQETGPMTSLA